jgi:hypothetical protein
MRLFWIFIFLLPQTAWAVALPRYGVFSYADMCFSTVDGDWDGTRIIVMRLPEGDDVRYSIGEGGISVLQGVAKIRADGAISFDLDDIPGAHVGPVHFKGRMTEHVLSGRLSYTAAPGDPIRLPAARDGANRNIDCHRK